MENGTIFLTAMLAQFIAEMGDKTQILLVAMTSRYKIRNIIAGTVLAVLVLNAAAVLAGGAVSSVIPAYIIKTAAAIAFLLFAITNLSFSDKDEKEKNIPSKFEILAIFLTFVIAEAGDKTQFTAITFGATWGIKKAVLVWLACSAGLFLADMLGLAVSLLLKNFIKPVIMKILSFLIFTGCGFFTLHEAVLLFPKTESSLMLPVMLVTAAVFTSASALVLYSSIRKSRDIHKAEPIENFKKNQ